MMLYHGSYLEIVEPDLVHSRPNVDFGRGFYVTPLYDQAAKWCGKFKRRGKDGVISRYEFDEERKAELMAQNKMSDGRMFKLDFDPRVIGNKILPDGTRKTGIGEFIRKTSLDEFPQFWNVLNGVGGIIEPTEKKLDFTGFSLA